MPIKGELRPGLARAYTKGRATLPATLSSADLARLSADIRERSIFSARTVYAQHLQRINDVIARIVSPETGAEGPAQSGYYMNPATARLELKRSLSDVGYLPGTTGPIGSLEDLASDKRIDLIIRMNSEFAWGHGRYMAARDPAAINAWPAQELYRLENRDQKRPWLEKWVRAGGQAFEGGTDSDLENRRLIALKADPIWTEISEFGLPYPPFDWNSGMWVRDVSRGEAEDLGLLEEGAMAPSPPERGFNEDLQSSVSDMDTCIATNTLYSVQNASTLVNCTNAYPLFVDNDYYSALVVTNGSQLGTNFVLGPSGIAGLKLQATSPAVDRGINEAWMTGAVDYFGNDRIYNTTVDIGAYEYTASGAVTINPTLYFLAHQLLTEGRP